MPLCVHLRTRVGAMVGRDNKFLDSLYKSEVDSFLMFANCDPPPNALDESSSRSEGSSTLQCHGGILGESDLSWFAECDECVAVAGDVAPSAPRSSTDTRGESAPGSFTDTDTYIR